MTGDEDALDPLTASFEAERERLFAIAYRMLGSASEAQDIVQDAYLRFRSAGRNEVRSARAYLSAIVTRLCLDQIKSARVRRERYVGPWLPEPVRTDPAIDPSSISLAFLVLLESLTPAERAAYVLHEVFEYSHAEVAAILEREEGATRQLVHRARQHLLDRKPRFAPSRAAHRELLERFRDACTAGDVGGLESLLSRHVASWSDGGGKVQAARKPVTGPRAVARLYIAIFRQMTGSVRLRIEEINGLPALLICAGKRLYSVISIESDGTEIHSIRCIVNPDKLGSVARLASREAGAGPA